MTFITLKPLKTGSRPWKSFYHIWIEENKTSSIDPFGIERNTSAKNYPKIDLPEKRLKAGDNVIIPLTTVEMEGTESRKKVFVSGTEDLDEQLM